MSDPMFDKALKMMGKNWANAKKQAATTGYANELPDARYKMTITKAETGFSKKSQRPQVTWTYKVLDGEFKDKTKLDWSGLDTEMSQMWLGRMLVKLGYELPDDISEISEIVADIPKQKFVLVCTLKTKNEFQKVYIDEIVEGEKAEGVTEEETVEEEEVTEEGALEKGTLVKFTSGGKEIEAEIVSVEEGQARVKTGEGKVYKLSVEKLTVVETEEVVPEEPVEEEVVEEEEEVPEEPVEEEEKPKAAKKPVAKKVTPKSKKKR